MVIPERNNWQLGLISDPWWTGYQDLDYVNEPFNDPVAVQQWRELGYTQTRFTGDLYDMRRPEPSWIAPFREIFVWQHWAWSVYRMPPGTVLPLHADTYGRYRDIYGVADVESVRRAVVFLEDWQSGHYFEIAGHAVTDWAQGEYVIWQGATPHLAANMGSSSRYTLQITGVADENTLT